MPYKDLEKQRQAQREQMKRRRAELKAQSGNAVIPQGAPLEMKSKEPKPAPQATPTEEHALPKVAATAQATQSEKGDFDPVNDWTTDKMITRWVLYPKEAGFPCIKTEGKCCFPYRHGEPRQAVTDCVFNPAKCIFFKESWIDHFVGIVKGQEPIREIVLAVPRAQSDGNPSRLPRLSAS